MAEIVVGFLLNELSIFLHSQYANLRRGLQEDVQFIRDELESMRAFLRDAESKEDDINFELQEWFRQVREVAYDTEDVLDEFLMRFAPHQADGFRGRVRKIYTSIKNLRCQYQISSKIKHIKAKVENISARHQRYQSIYGTQKRATTSSIMTNAEYDIRANQSLIEEAKLVGIDNPKGEIISQILDDNMHLKVVSVVGMGGLGKTTLVRKVYDDAAVKKQFQCHVWLTITQTFHIMVAIKNLIRQLYAEIRESVPSEVVECNDVLWLSAFVRDFLQERRYILVLDDVWNINSWEDLKPLLPDKNLGSRVMLTTRIVDVASISCLESHDYILKMKPLTYVESWTLFCNRTFQSNECPPQLKDISTSILKKCEGLPLAIAAIGGVLALKNKDRRDEWEMILHSLGSEIEGGGKLDRMKRILFLSYNDLPHHLKCCMLYLSIYPEDYEISVDELFGTWMAQGFIQEKEGMSPFDIARGYVNELVNRSLIQEVSASDDGTLEYCSVHDIMRDIIVSKSREQNFITIATGYCTRRSEKVRQLAIHDWVDNSQPQELHDIFKSLRSLEFFEYKSPLSTSALSKCLRSGSKLLKVLNLRGASLEDIPKEVFKLFLLKYLSLEDTQVQMLPKSIGKLRNLEFLDLSGTNITEVPTEILKLKKLRSLYVGTLGDYSENYAWHSFKSLDGIGKLLSLEFLCAMEVDNDKIVREIGKLTKLRELTITKLRRADGKDFLSSLVKLTNLRVLSVTSIEEDETLDLQHSIPSSSTPRFLQWLIFVGRLEKVPQWVISLQGLTALQLKHSGLKEDGAEGGIESLQDLPNLMSLDINHAYEGETLFFRSGGFPKLKRLYLVKLERLKKMQVREGSLPSLQNLEMVDCKQVEEFPLGIENLSNMEYLGLLEMSDMLIQKVQNIDKQSEEYQRIAHIPEICIGYWTNGAWKTSFL